MRSTPTAAPGTFATMVKADEDMIPSRRLPSSSTTTSPPEKNGSAGTTRSTTTRIGAHRRPATTTAVPTTASSTPSSINTRSKTSFRFPKFSLKSPSVLSSASASVNYSKSTTTSPTAAAIAAGGGGGVSQSATTTPSNNNSNPKITKRMRSFPLLRRRHSAGVEASPAAAVAMTSLATVASGQQQQPHHFPSSPSSGTSNSTNSSSSSAAQQQQQQREEREDYIKVFPVHHSFRNSSSREGHHQEHHDDVEGAAAAAQQHDNGIGNQQRMTTRQSVVGGEEDQLAIVLATDPRQQQLRDAMNEPFTCGYLEMVCGRKQLEQEAAEAARLLINQQRRLLLSEDPTVQDSIECVFASQLAAGVSLWSSSNSSNDDKDNSSTKKDRRKNNSKNQVRSDSSISSSYHSTRSYEDEPINAPSEAELPSPAPLMQSRQKSRTPSAVATKSMIPSKRRSHPSSHMQTQPIIHNNNNNQVKKAPQNPHHHHNLNFASDNDDAPSDQHATTPKRSKQRVSQSNNAYSMEEDPMGRVGACSTPPPRSSAAPCYCHSHSVPVVPAEYWPQAPLLLRPTPGQGMSIRGIRFSGQAESEHFWKPSDGGWWLTPFYELAGKEAPTFPPSAPSMCSQCCLLPINNGNEPVGEALVADFETPLFEGTLLVRLRHVDGGATSTDPALEDYNDSQGYFDGLNRRYQVAIRGKFKQPVPMTGLVSGLVMDRPFGKLPPKWIVKGAVKVLSFFAPQLEFQMDTARPTTMAPLGSTPQALIVSSVGPNDTLPLLDAAIEEPKSAKTCLLGTAFSGTSSLQRARGRKKAFDKLYAQKRKHPMAKTSHDDEQQHETYYTFEFLQHLVNFQDFSVELGNLLGSLPLAPILAGHPIPVMAMIKDGGQQKLWSFDIWHENLVESAEAYDAKQKKTAAIEQQ